MQTEREPLAGTSHGNIEIDAVGPDDLMVN